MHISVFFLNNIHWNIKIQEIGRGHVKDFFNSCEYISRCHIFSFSSTQTISCLLLSCLHTLPSAGTIQTLQQSGESVSHHPVSCFGMVCPQGSGGLRFEMYHALFAACFVRLSALYMLRRRDWMVEGWINEDKARAPLGVFLYSPLTQAERFPPRLTIQTLPRGTVTSRFGKRERERRNQKERVR